MTSKTIAKYNNQIVQIKIVVKIKLVMKFTLIFSIGMLFITYEM